MIRQIVYLVCFGILLIFGMIMLFKKIREMNEEEIRIERRNDKNDN